MILRPLLCLLWAPSVFAGVFLPEVGNYRYTLESVEERFHNDGLHHLTLAPAVDREATYKINRRREFQIKDWYAQDWFKLQDNFILDTEAYLRHYQGESFNEAKRNAYGKLSFSRLKNRHRHKSPTMREWGGLNHPPVKVIEKPLGHYSPMHTTKAPINNSAGYFNPALQVEIDETSDSELSFGNKLTLLEDNGAFLAKKALIQSAREQILMGALVFVCDKGTREIVDLLIERHQAGVNVRVIVDATISKYLGHRECTKRMRDAGIEVMEGDDFWQYGRAIYHTKSLVVDFKTAISGGHNMLDADNLSRGTDFQNRDVDLQSEGPMVTDIAMALVKDWQYFFNKKRRPGLTSLAALEAKLQEKLAQERAQGLRGGQNYARILGDSKTRTAGVCRYIRQSPSVDRQSIGRAYLLLLDQVEAYLALTNPVTSDSKVTRLNRPLLPVFEWKDRFGMYNKLWTKLQGMAKSGTRIDFITTNMDMSGNENVAMLNDEIREQVAEGREGAAHWSLAQIGLWNRFYGGPHFKNLLKDWAPHESVHVWTHISFMHSKVFHFDRIAASIGSYNLQHNATDHAHEATAICQDDSLNEQLDRVLVQDMANSIPLIFK
jgi:phosphatidylserine/phosphatidylglycerophosphate/cardiolipin synthase-like enzyme